MTASSAGSWHCDEPALAAFVDGTVDPVSGASVETHLMGCPTCRETVARLSSTELLEDVWLRVRESVEPPPPGLVQQVLEACGVSEATGRLLAAVPSLRGAWLLAVGCATLFAVLATAVSQLVGLAAFLLIAPLAPLAGVSASFGGGAEPASELVLSCPYSTLRLLMLRTSAVLVSAVPVAIAVGLALPGSSWFSVAWLLPAAAVVLVTLALGPALGHTTSAAVVGATWAMAVVISLRLREPAVLVEPAVQSVYLLVAVAAALSVVHHYRSSSLTWRRT